MDILDDMGVSKLSAKVSETSALSISLTSHYMCKSVGGAKEAMM